eukprot:TRINITY_DN54046_c0_g1_i1.p1 TRINITY_DN54046_c0_g1~~TRINITY_DN54046_c0_g1_i1.p1  ORF type:complete len:773 (-),score=136.51 TRINITY_DN54046_c0_g1_i1:64-2382(-)
MPAKHGKTTPFEGGFSAKKKQQMMKEKRERTKKSREEWGNKWDWQAQEQSKEVAQTLAKQLAQHDATVLETSTKFSSGKLQSAFELESREVIEARKLCSQQPFGKRLASEGVPWTDYVQIGGDSGVLPSPIRLPTRPDWDAHMSKEEVEQREEVEFKKWLKAVVTTFGGKQLSYFERNLEVWRQLWRVLEMSDVVLVIADARFPAVHLPFALYQYVDSVLKKPIILILNKIDLIEAEALERWKRFFAAAYPNLQVLEFTCFPVEGTVTAPASELRRKGDRKRRMLLRRVSFYDYLPDAEGFVEDPEEAKERQRRTTLASEARRAAAEFEARKRERALRRSRAGDLDEEDQTSELPSEDESVPPDSPLEDDDMELFKGQRKLERELETEPDYRERRIVAQYLQTILDTARSSFSKYYPGRTPRNGRIVIGTVGHPNVGKSSIINCLNGFKVVSVSPSPGHTKHFQTINLGDDITLCDCPGLVFPFINMPRSLQIVTGLYPLAQCREPYSALQYVCERLPVEQLFRLTKPEWYEPGDDWSAWMVCEAYALFRGFYIHRGKGIPDTHRAALHLLKQVLNGQLVLFFMPPPVGAHTALSSIVEPLAAPEGPDANEGSEGSESSEGEPDGTARAPKPMRVHVDSDEDYEDIGHHVSEDQSLGPNSATASYDFTASEHETKALNNRTPPRSPPAPGTRLHGSRKYTTQQMPAVEEERLGLVRRHRRHAQQVPFEQTLNSTKQKLAAEAEEKFEDEDEKPAFSNGAFGALGNHGRRRKN